jgi:hypothetical protein
MEIVNSIIHGFEEFYATPFGAGVGFVTLVWLIIDIVKKIR